MMAGSTLGNDWTLRAAHRLDCAERCIDCTLLFGDIRERAVMVCDADAAKLGAELEAARLEVLRRVEL